jgi:phosphodiesterase/alkaline phosphatase D-like protein
VTITYTAAPKPTATTHKATGVKSTSATVHGSVNGHGLATTYRFQWGTSKHYGHQTSSHKMKASSSAKSVAALLRGLKPGTRYHFRVVAKNASGTALGKDMTFKTKAAASGPVFTG